MLTFHTDLDSYVKSVCNAHFTYGSESVCKNPYVTLTLPTDLNPYVKIYI